MDDKEKRKAEVRARLEQAAAEKKKKGFMTPERKKKLRTLLRKKAAEELKREQERKAEERRKIISQRTGQPRNVEDANEAELIKICTEYYNRIEKLQSEKYDLEYEVTLRDLEVREVATKVNDEDRKKFCAKNLPPIFLISYYYKTYFFSTNDVRGRFIKPPLKKVSKTAQQMEKIRMFTAKIGQMDYRQSLKTVKKFDLEVDKEVEKEKPEWAAVSSGKSLPTESDRE